MRGTEAHLGNGSQIWPGTDRQPVNTMSNLPAPPASIPYLSPPLLEHLSITTDEVIDSVEQLIPGQRRGQVWSAPKAVVVPGRALHHGDASGCGRGSCAGAEPASPVSPR
jgi:hypothetical protein